MKVFKFGGASVKNAEAVKNVGNVINLFQDDLVVVVSAMDKTTNALEKVVDSYINKDGNSFKHLEEVKVFHYSLKTFDLIKILSILYTILIFLKSILL